MIPHTHPACQTSTEDNWQKCLKQAIRDPAELLQLLALSPTLLPAARRAAELFPLRVPRGYVARMEKGNPHDPLLRQVLPLEAEMQPVPGFEADPVGDLAAMSVPGLLHKYAHRVLLIASPTCAVHCRYCFRREFPYDDGQLSHSRMQPAFDYIRQDSSIHEVILSGGDPLSLSNPRLTGIIQTLAAIPHLKRLRLHSRQPIVLPQRVDAGLLASLRQHRLQTILVIHCNHPHELAGDVLSALSALHQQGITLLNQSVLLRDINDTVATLTALSEALFAAGVLPYYLHQLDRVRGAAHFAVSDSRAVTLLQQIRLQLPGYLVPRLVRENAGEGYKLPIES